MSVRLDNYRTQKDYVFVTATGPHVEIGTSLCSCFIKSRTAWAGRRFSFAGLRDGPEMSRACRDGTPARAVT